MLFPDPSSMFLMIPGYYLIYCIYCRVFRNKCTLTFHPTPQNLLLVKKSNLQTLNLFKAHFFFPSAFFQTFLSSFDMRIWSFQKPIELKAIHYRVPEAETSIDFVYYQSEDQNEENKKFLLILPGLTGSIEAAYIRELCDEALKNGFRPIVLNSRWLSKPIKLPKQGPINFIDDLKKTIEYIVQRNKSNEIYAIGISYGSNILCKYLGTIGQHSDIIKGAVSIGNPFNMYQNKSAINRFWNYILCKILQKALVTRKTSFKKTKKKAFESVSVDEALKATSFIDFDEYFTRRMLGYNSTDEYYKGFGCVSDIKNIKVPLLCLQTQDDPISHYEMIPFNESHKNHNLIFYTTERGGHIGWVEGFFNFKVYYPKPCLAFLKNIS